jgi:DNA-binding SARP family transcriptional activator
VSVRVLGAPAIPDADPRRHLRGKSLELLVYLVVHDGQASVEAILDDLLPDAPASKAAGRLHTYVSDLRNTLRRTGGAGSYLTHPGHRYVLNPDALDVDLWHMRAAVRRASTSPDRDTRVAALRTAVAAYSGHLAAGRDYEWIEPYREAVRQQALDACLALVELLADDPAAQLDLLHTAIACNRHTEALYQHAMRAHARLGHTDAVRTLTRQLARALAEIDAEPADDTIALARRLTTPASPGEQCHDRRTPPSRHEGAA